MKLELLRSFMQNQNLILRLVLQSTDHSLFLVLPKLKAVAPRPSALLHSLALFRLPKWDLMRQKLVC